MIQKSSKFKTRVCVLFLLLTFYLSFFTVVDAMINLGEFKAGTSIFYGANFHNDTGTIENPTSPEAQIKTPAGVWSDLTTPAIQNSKTGFYGGTIDTTGYAVGEYIIRMAGTVTTAKTVATVFSFLVVANIEADTYGNVTNGAYGLSALKDLINAIDTSTELQARFTEIKGVGWMDETLKAIKDDAGGGATPAEIWAYTTRKLTSRNIATGEDIAREQTLTGNLSSGVLQNMITVIDGSPQTIVRGDVKPFTFKLGAAWPLTDKKVYFIAKADKTASNSTAIINRACTITDLVNSVATITLTATETANIGSYFAEIEVRDLDETNPKTARQFILKISQDVRQ